MRGSSQSKLSPAAQEDTASPSWWPARCYKLSEELKGTNLACLVGDTGTCPSASSLSLKNISCSRFFWFSSSSRALSKENNTRAGFEMVLELWALSPPASQDTLLTAPPSSVVSACPSTPSCAGCGSHPGTSASGFRARSGGDTSHSKNTSANTTPISSWNCTSCGQMLG